MLLLLPSPQKPVGGPAGESGATQSGSAEELELLHQLEPPVALAGSELPTDRKVGSTMDAVVVARSSSQPAVKAGLLKDSWPVVSTTLCTAPLCLPRSQPSCVLI